MRQIELDVPGCLPGALLLAVASSSLGGSKFEIEIGQVSRQMTSVRLFCPVLHEHEEPYVRK
jgi:hypothetical protein